MSAQNARGMIPHSTFKCLVKGLTGKNFDRNPRCDPHI